jgi:hypothetical protein
MESFENDVDSLQIGQGILQGRSSGAPLYNINSNISLVPNQKLA